MLNVVNNLIVVHKLRVLHLHYDPVLMKSSVILLNSRLFEFCKRLLSHLELVRHVHPVSPSIRSLILCLPTKPARVMLMLPSMKCSQRIAALPRSAKVGLVATPLKTSEPPRTL